MFFSFFFSFLEASTFSSSSLVQPLGLSPGSHGCSLCFHGAFLSVRPSPPPSCQQVFLCGAAGTRALSAVSFLWCWVTLGPARSLHYTHNSPLLLSCQHWGTVSSSHHPMMLYECCRVDVDGTSNNCSEGGTEVRAAFSPGLLNVFPTYVLG
ncbi:uncharacterized [Lates japonicus]